MAAILHWPEADGPPVNTRYGDRYHAGRPLEQARAVFLAGCNLPAAWAGRARWRILETGFGLGSNFLTAWAAWRGDPARPGRLHYVAIEAHPVTRADLERHLHAVMAADPALAPLAHALLEAWWGLALGFHHLEFEAGCVTLTLAV
ncbi:MAG: FAD-dependent cmnm(5)s(2)U34 oxidoreductase, partial [Casimicrobiaceae bacterium]